MMNRRNNLILLAISLAILIAGIVYFRTIGRNNDAVSDVKQRVDQEVAKTGAAQKDVSQSNSSAQAKTEERDKMTEIERKRFTDIAQAECKRLDVPVAGRSITVTATTATATVVFSSPPNSLAGDFVIKIDRATGKVIDAKIWR